MNETKLKNRYGLAIKRALAGNITGQDVKAIVEYQLKDAFNIYDEPINEVELVILTHCMIAFN
jgi:hypothetical protein